MKKDGNKILMELISNGRPVVLCEFNKELNKEDIEIEQEYILNAEEMHQLLCSVANSSVSNISNVVHNVNKFVINFHKTIYSIKRKAQEDKNKRKAQGDKKGVKK